MKWIVGCFIQVFLKDPTLTRRPKPYPKTYHTHHKEQELPFWTSMLPFTLYGIYEMVNHGDTASVLEKVKSAAIHNAHHSAKLGE